MNIFLKDEAFLEFKEYIEVMYWNGLLSNCEFKVRRRYLFSLLERKSPFRDLFKDLDDNYDDNSNYDERPDSIDEKDAIKVEVIRRRGTFEDENIIHFYPIGTGAEKWEFHPFDDDYFPSIPHGHYLGKKYPKLDPYLGFIYDKNHTQSKMDKKIICALWNNDDFRDMVRKSISYYLNFHPHYKGWRVSNPLRLPQKRK